jgi:hypothetical protein
VLVTGLTGTEIVGAVPLNGVPSERTPLTLPTPATVKFRIVWAPLQMTASPEIAPVTGSGCAIWIGRLNGAVQPFASVTVTVWSPAVTPLKVLEFCGAPLSSV